MKPAFPDNYFCYYASPVGTIYIGANNIGICKMIFVDDEKPAAENLSSELLKARQELDLYFSGQLKSFSLTVAPEGTAFQQKVWQALKEIPYGKTISYSELSEIMLQPGAIRAIANANARNPVMILIPCHRVIGASGDLTGYAGGLHRKKFLLELEGSMIPSRQLSLL